MKLTLAHLLLLATFCLSLSIPSLFSDSTSSRSLASRNAAPEPEPEAALSDDEVWYIGNLPNEEQMDAYYDLIKRKGGGGGRGGGGGSSSGGGSKSGSSGGSSGSSSGGSSGGSRAPTSSYTNAPPTFGGGAFYPGGATRSYRAGGISPSGIRPGLIVGSAFGVGAASLYLYSYPHPYPYYHDPTTNRNQSLPVDCVCDQNSPCGCDDTNNNTLVQEMLKNSTIAKVQNVNGTKTVVINGTLVNGTTGAAAGSLLYSLGDFRQASNWWVVVAIGGGMIWGL